jgi:HK97 gp10 family phage protein
MATVTVKGDKLLITELASLPAKLRKKLLRTSLRKATKPTLVLARARAPQYTGGDRKGTVAGLLRKEIKLRVRTKKNKVLAWIGLGQAMYTGQVFYAWFQEFGWLAGGKRIKGALARLAARALGIRRQVPAKKFLRNAYDSTESQVLKVLEEDLNATIAGGP